MCQINDTLNPCFHSCQNHRRCYCRSMTDQNFPTASHCMLREPPLKAPPPQHTHTQTRTKHTHTHTHTHTKAHTKHTSGKSSPQEVAKFTARLFMSSVQYANSTRRTFSSCRPQLRNTTPASAIQNIVLDLRRAVRKWRLSSVRTANSNGLSRSCL